MKDDTLFPKIPEKITIEHRVTFPDTTPVDKVCHTALQIAVILGIVAILFAFFRSRPNA